MSYVFAPNFEATDHPILILVPTQKPSQNFGVKSDLIQKWLKLSKKYFTRLHVLRYSFISANPLLACMSFFSFFFGLDLVHSSSPKPENIEI